jgi:hypothetical protein
MPRGVTRTFECPQCGYSDDSYALVRRHQTGEEHPYLPIERITVDPGLPAPGD